MNNPQISQIWEKRKKATEDTEGTERKRRGKK